MVPLERGLEGALRPGTDHETDAGAGKVARRPDLRGFGHHDGFGLEESRRADKEAIGEMLCVDRAGTEEDEVELAGAHLVEVPDGIDDREATPPLRAQHRHRDGAAEIDGEPMGAAALVVRLGETRPVLGAAARPCRQP